MSSSSSTLLEFGRRKRTRSNLSVFSLPTLAKRPHLIEEVPELVAPSVQVTAPSEEEENTSDSEVYTDATSSSSASSDADSSEESSEDDSDDTVLPNEPTPQDGISLTGELEEEYQLDLEAEETSSSSSSSSSASDAGSPSPSHTLKFLEDSGASTATIPIIPGRDARFHKISSSALSDRLKSFLPALKTANKELEEASANGLKSRDIENISDEDGESRGYIEMNLGLGVLEEKGNDGDNDSDSETSSSSESEPDGIEATEKLDGKGGVTSKHKKGSERDVMGKLLGKARRQRPDIEVVENPS